jgi:hypothetical protein
MMSIIKSLVDASKLGGWIRAGVAAGAGYAAAKMSGDFATLFSNPEFVGGLSVVLSGIAVAVWSQIVKDKTPPAPPAPPAA